MNVCCAVVGFLIKWYIYIHTSTHYLYTLFIRIHKYDIHANKSVRFRVGVSPQRKHFVRRTIKNHVNENTIDIYAYGNIIIFIIILIRSKLNIVLVFQSIIQ